ncbi:alanine racemase [Candidatus Desulfovibrio trichonymphae]|uniref:Alanine racemase n=1 Tax=Candidatus Desulfovibrio trichonymphae TaxID=1725232 RepID=A0A1J1E540_9BACT|nr:alanine racemase [Candidatus Desulfovibrio trichonymphae]BAV92576.1 alanine racemase [Candidatus Desulfovibrio trichonymphae]GHV00526.1 alanine racemase [Deltaproteobacteria bacterium]
MSECTFTPSMCHIDLPALQRNFARLGKSAALMPVIKSDAYGHGLLPVARSLADVGARRFAVGTVSEGAALREAGLTQEIVPLLGGVNAEDWHRAAAHSLVPLLADREDLEKADFCCRPDKTLRVALKCETGMARLGFTAEDIPAVLEFLRARPHLAPALVLSHLACADRPLDLAYTHAQTERFTAVCDSLRVAFPDMERSLANSAGLLGLPETRFEVSRPGIALYGGNPFAGTALENCGASLEWVMSVSAPVLCVQRVKAGQSVSYGRIFTTPADMTIAVIAAGYATGLDRRLSNSMDVLIGGRRVPQVGRICMGLLMADVSSLPETRRGDEAWLIGGPVAHGQRAVTAREMADELDTISYEILCRMGAMNPRTYG